MNKRIPALVGILFVLVTLACGTATPVSPTVTLDPNLLDTVVAATVAALEPTSQTSEAAQPTPADTPEAPQATLAEPTADLPPECLPAHPGAQALPLPVGFAASINTLAVEFFDPDGNVLGNKPTPGMTWLDPNQIHLGGGLNAGLPSMMLVYYSLENNGGLKSSENGAVSPLRPLPNMITLTGAEGASLLAFSTNEIDMSPDAGGWVSYLYAGDAEAINGAQPMLTRSEGDGFVIFPLAVHIEGGIGQGVWYTLSMWGIGNINFAPYNGLYYYDFMSGQSTEFLGFSERIAGLSPDQTRVAYLPGMGGQPGGPGNSLTLRDLTTCQETGIPFNASTNLGGGFVNISPNNQYLAWLEASGPSNMEAQMRLRVATSNGLIVADTEIANLNGLAGGEAPLYLRPAGWIADHLLLVEISIPSQASPLMVVWAPDPAQPLAPALGANQSAPLADGVFAGFLYP